MSKIRTLPFDAANYLKSDAEMVDHLNMVLEDGTSAEIAAALGAIGRARGMATLASDAGMSRESLYKALSGDRVPSAETLIRVIRALGLTLQAQVGYPSKPI